MIRTDKTWIKTRESDKNVLKQESLEFCHALSQPERLTDIELLWNVTMVQFE